MKRKLLGVSVCASCFTAVAAFAGGPEIVIKPDYFSGFFIGGTGAFHMAGFSTSSSIVALQPVGAGLVAFGEPQYQETFFPSGTLMSADVDGNAYDGFYGVQGGVGKVFNHRWYAGVTGFGEWGSQVNTANAASHSLNQEGNIGVTPGSALIETVYNSSTTVKISNDYGVAFKPGFLFSPTSMIYGKVGAVWANIKVSNSASGDNAYSAFNVGPELAFTRTAAFTGLSNNTENKLALLLGIGFEQFIYRDVVTLNIEYNYANYGHVSTSTNTTGIVTYGGGVAPIVPAGTAAPLDNPVTIQASASAKVSTLLGGINFYFGNRWF